MGQLESYTIQDIFLVAILSGVLSTYFAEEIEATIESVVAYVYSANSFVSKKRVASAPKQIIVGTAGDATHTSFNFLGLTKATFVPIEKPIDERVVWQDLFLQTWHTSGPSKSLANFEDSHKKLSA